MSENLLLAVVGLMFGAAGLGFAIGFRLGYFREKGQWYFDKNKPAPVRNAPIASLAGSVFLLASGVLIALGMLGGTAAHETLIAISSVIWFISGTFVWIWSFRPPEWAKPDWLREAEKAAVTAEVSEDGEPADKG